MDFRLSPKHSIAAAFRQNGVFTFREAIAFVRALPYRRPTEPSDPLAVLLELRGTCSSKHDLLKRLADEHLVDDPSAQVELILCLFRLSIHNTPRAAGVLRNGPLDIMPEAHAYLRWGGERIDATGSGIDINAFLDDILVEEAISSAGIASKAAWHRAHLSQFLDQHHPHISLETAWLQRERVIAALVLEPTCEPPPTQSALS